MASSGIPRVPYRTVFYWPVVILLWALVVLNSAIDRGLFWDGASFLANMLEFHKFHDFYHERQHVGWVTQAPTLLAAKAGLHNTRWLAFIYSATLFAVPTALYHLALARTRARGDAMLMAGVLLAIGTVYLPTWFFIVGEYNAAYAAAMATMAVVLTGDGRRRGDGVLICVIGALCIASYESMIYMGPLVASAILWSRHRARRAAIPADDVTQMLYLVAAAAFLGATVVAACAIQEYWDYPYFVNVRAASFDFWQNLQFVIPFASLAVLVFVSLLRPGWLAGRAPYAALIVVALAVAMTPTLFWLNPNMILFPPAHYVARTAAGWLLAAIMLAMWLHVGWRRSPPRVLLELRRPEVGRRLGLALAILVFCAAVPDLVLSRMWLGYLDYFRSLVIGHTGIVRANDLPMRQWPYKLFSQDWTYPALSALVRSAPGEGVVAVDNDYRSNPPFDPACGTVPRLEGFAWR
jgi:hypothetical protein